MPTITPLPDPPSRNDPTNFASRADAFLAALPVMVDEFNAATPGDSAAGLAAALAGAAAGQGASLVTRQGGGTVQDAFTAGSGTGAETVPFLPAGSDAAPRSVQSKLRELASVADRAGATQERFIRAATAGAAFVPAGTHTLTDQVDGVFWALDDETTAEPNGNADIRFLSRMASTDHAPARIRQLLRANLYLQNNHLQGLVNIGDSISHGAYSGNAYTNHWTYLLARALRAEFGGESVGEYPMEGLYNPVGGLVTPQLADVVHSAGWGATSADPAPYNYPVGNIGSASADVVNGKTYSSTTSGATITLTLPSMGRAISFKYRQQVGGGTFTVSVNGVVKLTVDTNGASAHNVSTNNVAIEDNGRGECVVTITKSDANQTEINALFNLRTDSVGLTDLGARMQFHNYAQSGRALKDMSEAAIARVCNSAGLLVSLGYNDWSLGSDSDDGVFAAFRQRIDWLIQYARVYGTLVVVQDFCWYASKHSRTRRQLKRLALATRGLYIPYPEQFFAAGGQPVASPPQLNDPLHLWADAAHPNALGNELIFSTLATALGLSCNSRALALKHHDWPFPLKIDSGSTVVNSATAPASLTTIQQQGDAYLLRLALKPTAATLVQNTTVTALTALPAKFRGGESISLLPQTVPAAINTSTGAGKTFAIVESPATVKVHTNAAGETAVRCAIPQPRA